MPMTVQAFLDAVRDIPLLREQYEAACFLQDKCSQNEITVSVIGQFKRGKSSLINTLLGEQLLPVGIIPLTTVITEIRYGVTFSAEVFLLDGSSKIIQREQLPDYLSEQRNPKNGKNVRSVKIRTPNFPFPRDIVLADTPGVGSVHQHNTDSAYSYVQKSDAVLFLLSYDSPISETERDFLSAVKEYAAKFFFAVNKADTVSDADAGEFIAFCTKVIEELTEISCRIFSISAKTGSGVSALADSIKEELSGSEEILLEKSNELKLISLRKQACAKAEIYLNAALLPKNELENKLMLLDENCRKLSLFAESIGFLAKQRNAQLISEIGEALDRLCMQAKTELSLACESLLELHGDLPYRKFCSSAEEQINAMVREKLTEMNRMGLEQLSSGYLELMDVLNTQVAEIADATAAMMMQEFGHSFSLSSREYRVSSRSNLHINVGLSTTYNISLNDLERFLPKQAANKRISKRIATQALDDLERNRNNMISNYRYKVQESLRSVTGEMVSDIEGLEKELNGLKRSLEARLLLTESEYRQTCDMYSSLLAKLS